MELKQNIKLLHFFLDTMLDCCNSISNNEWVRFFTVQVERMYQLNQLTSVQKEAIVSLACSIGNNNSKAIALEQIQRICYAISGITENTNISSVQKTLQSAVAYSVVRKDVMCYIMTFLGLVVNTTEKSIVTKQVGVKKSIAKETVVTTDNIRHVAERIYRLVYKEHKDIVLYCKNSVGDGCTGSRAYIYKNFTDMLTEEMTYGFHGHTVEEICERTKNPKYDGCSGSRMYDYATLYIIQDTMFGRLCCKIVELIEENRNSMSVSNAQIAQAENKKETSCKTTVDPCVAVGRRNMC